MFNQEHYKKQLIAAINSYIRLINNNCQYHEHPIRVLHDEWVSYFEDNGDTFVAILTTVKGEKEKIKFHKAEWKSINVNILTNGKLKKLLNKFSS